VTGQRINLLLNNPFLTDSRSWKIARSLAAAGWRVTVIARPGEGLPAHQTQDGFEVIRVAQPVPRWLRAPRLPTEEESDTRSSRVVGLMRDTIGRAVQTVRFTVLARSWADAVGRVAPDADIWQSEGLITLPLAIALARQRGGKVAYDSRDVHLESARFARLPGPWRRLLAWRERRWTRLIADEPVLEIDADQYLQRVRSIDPDIWIIEIEDAKTTGLLDFSTTGQDL